MQKRKRKSRSDGRQKSCHENKGHDVIPYSAEHNKKQQNKPKRTRHRVQMENERDNGGKREEGSKLDAGVGVTSNIYKLTITL